MTNAGNEQNIDDFADLSPDFPGTLQEARPDSVIPLVYDSAPPVFKRRLRIYTPPNYDSRRKEPYPVIYLLHGRDDTDETWTVEGHAHRILDHLLARPDAKPVVPMVVVMPMGFTGQGDETKEKGEEREWDPDRLEREICEIIPAFLRDKYHLRQDRQGWALAGASRGGKQALIIGLGRPEQFGWVGAFSVEVLRDEVSEEKVAFLPPALDGRVGEQPRIWIRCGTQDKFRHGVFGRQDRCESNRRLAEWLGERGFQVNWQPTGGDSSWRPDNDHAWPVWSRYLYRFASELFHEPPSGGQDDGERGRTMAEEKKAEQQSTRAAQGAAPSPSPAYPPQGATGSNGRGPFNFFAQDNQGKTEELFRKHPLQLDALREAFWTRRADPVNRPGEASLSDAAIVALDLYKQEDLDKLPAKPTAQWEHLIYAYMIENTGIYEIFRRVLYEFVHGERLETPSLDGQRWLRNTEQLFYRDPTPYPIFSIVSHIRPDIRALRGNNYWRMFGLDLTHGIDDNVAYPEVKPTAANTDFVATFEQLLREVWKGIINLDNTTGPKTTDDSAIANRARLLSERLTARRLNGNLSREEFQHVTTMSWFHLTVRFNTPIVQDLRADASSADERLRKIADRVGVPAHAKSDSLFELADPLSRLLLEIEKGTFNTSADAPKLYDTKKEPSFKSIQNDVKTIITHWSIVMGRDVKGPPVSPSP